MTRRKNATPLTRQPVTPGAVATAVALGATDEELATILGVSETELADLLAQPLFAQVHRRARIMLDLLVCQQYVKVALGGDREACKQWLQARRPDQFGQARRPGRPPRSPKAPEAEPDTPADDAENPFSDLRPLRIAKAAG